MHLLIGDIQTMAHWHLRGRTAEHKENGHERQERIKREHNKPEQNEGYDEAARGGKGVPASNVGTSPDEPMPGAGDEFDKAARQAKADVRRRENSAK